MIDYEEAKHNFKEAKAYVRKQIAEVLAQADEPMTAAEIGALIGVSKGSVAMLINNDAWQSEFSEGTIPYFLKALSVRRPEIFYKSRVIQETVVSTKDPSKCYTINHEYKTYYIEK